MKIEEQGVNILGNEVPAIEYYIFLKKMKQEFYSLFGYQSGVFEEMKTRLESNFTNDDVKIMDYVALQEAEKEYNRP